MPMDDSDLSSFGELLKTFRMRKRLTQQQLAAALGMHRHTIGRWEQGDVLPASKTLVLELARHLRLDELETRHLLEASLTALAPHWLVPFPRNPYFTGREEILEALHAQIGVGQTIALTQSSALHGLGGVGKTQIALEYAYRYALEYRAVFWIEAEQLETVRASFLRIAKLLQVPEYQQADQHQAITAVQRWLTKQGQWLLIWDNLEAMDVLPHFLPPARQGAVFSPTDPLQSFLDACCELHPRAWCRISDLGGAYEQWGAERQERFPLSRRAFAAQVKAHGCSPDRTSTARIWRGVALRNARGMTTPDKK